MLRKISYFLVLIVINLSWLGCDDSGVNNTDYKIIEIIDDISENTTWTAPNIYLIKDHDFYINANLVIEPGVIVMFTARGMGIKVSGSGVIKANGTLADPIIFTSIKDDLPAGDINGDGTTTLPSAKDWDGIDLIHEQNGHVFANCEFRYAGHDFNSALSAGTGSIEVSNCVFSKNGGGPKGDFWYGALELEYASSASNITDNIFYDNDLPLIIGTNINLDASNVFHNPIDVSIINKYNGIFVNTINEIATAISWLETEIAFVIDDNDFWVKSNASLTLGNNVVLKFTKESTLSLSDGVSALNNYNGAEVAFTSFKDDTRKGDTNADASATSPVDNDWNQITNGNAKVGEPDWFSWSNIYYDAH